MEAQANSYKKEYYKELILKHKSALAKAREMIEQLLDKLQQQINLSEIPQNEETVEKSAEYELLFGSKESASSVLIKLTTILLKIIPLEQEIARADLNKADILELEEIAQESKIPEEDLAIIERYIEKYNEEKA